MPSPRSHARVIGYIKKKTWESVYRAKKWSQGTQLQTGRPGLASLRNWTNTHMFHKLWAVMAAMRLWLSAYKPPNTMPSRTSTTNLCRLKWTHAKIRDETVTAIHRGMNLVKDGIRNPRNISCRQQIESAAEVRVSAKVTSVNQMVDLFHCIRHHAFRHCK